MQDQIEEKSLGLGYEVPASLVFPVKNLNSWVDRLTIYLNGKIDDYRFRHGGITEFGLQKLSGSNL
jgi:hypothetical protein